MRSVLLLVLALLASACSVQAESIAGETEFVVQDGHEAILAAQGEPYILWFWGAN